ADRPELDRPAEHGGPAESTGGHAGRPRRHGHDLRLARRCPGPQRDQPAGGCAPGGTGEPGLQQRPDRRGVEPRSAGRDRRPAEPAGGLDGSHRHDHHPQRGEEPADADADAVLADPDADPDRDLDRYLRRLTSARPGGPAAPPTAGGPTAWAGPAPPRAAVGRATTLGPDIVCAAAGTATARAPRPRHTRTRRSTCPNPVSATRRSTPRRHGPPRRRSARPGWCPPWSAAWWWAWPGSRCSTSPARTCRCPRWGPGISRSGSASSLRAWGSRPSGGSAARPLIRRRRLIGDGQPSAPGPAARGQPSADDTTWLFLIMTAATSTATIATVAPTWTSTRCCRGA